jgi:hypothetical protein
MYILKIVYRTNYVAGPFSISGSKLPNDESNAKQVVIQNIEKCNKFFWTVYSVCYPSSDDSRYLMLIRALSSSWYILKVYFINT